MADRNKDNNPDGEALQPSGSKHSGLSLNELSEAFSQLIGKGQDPYEDGVPEQESSDSDVVSDAHQPTTSDSTEGDQACPLSPRSILEAILFVGHPTNKPLTSRMIAALMRGVRPEEIDELVAELNETYESDGSPYKVVSVGAGYCLQLKDEFGSLRSKFYRRVRETKLSQAAIDVLAIVAYNQPMSRDRIDQLRGKPSGAVLSQLVRRQLLQVEMSQTKPRKPKYSTTSRFLSVFRMEDLQELPRGQEDDPSLSD